MHLNMWFSKSQFYFQRTQKYFCKFYFISPLTLLSNSCPFPVFSYYNTKLWAANSIFCSNQIYKAVSSIQLQIVSLTWRNVLPPFLMESTERFKLDCFSFRIIVLVALPTMWYFPIAKKGFPGQIKKTSSFP